MIGNGKVKLLLRRLIDASCFRPVHIGQYVRSLNFRRQYLRLPLQRFCRILDAGSGSGSYAAEQEHVGEQYTPLELSGELRQIGFKVLHARYTFGWLGQIAWELDRLTDRRWKTKIILMPLLKLLARMSLLVQPRRGGVMVVAQK